jgi:hypothetical protein
VKQANRIYIKVLLCTELHTYSAEEDDNADENNDS